MKTTEKKLLSNEEIASFCSQTAMLFQAGIPPMEGMAILQSDAGSPEGKAIFDEISPSADREKASTKHWNLQMFFRITASA